MLAYVGILWLSVLFHSSVKMTDVGLHPVLDAMQALGCKSKAKISLAMQVYLDLCEVKTMWDPKYFYNPKLDLIFMKGKWSKNDAVHDIIVPLSASSSVSPAWLLQVQNELCRDEERRVVTLAFVAGDSSICYYQAGNGLQPPDSPETVNKRRCKEERRQCKKADMMQKAQDIISEMVENDPVQENANDHIPND